MHRQLTGALFGLFLPISVAAQSAGPATLAPSEVAKPAEVVARQSEAPKPAMTADDVARRAIDTLAGPAWEKARYIAFTFAAERDGKIVAAFPQRWDRYTGAYRVSGKDAKGNDFVVNMNTNTKEGKAWLNGAPVADAKELLAMGYRRFVNDTYWLLMPLKALDPGVHRELAPERVDCGRAYDVVHLSFDQGVGLTSADQYWMVVDRDTGMVEEWDMKLQGSKPDDAPNRVMFRDYRRVGSLLISRRRETVGRNGAIRLDDLQVEAEVPATAFKD